ncbi:MAG: helix-turn-helix protein [Firmicutes bacterium]|nr:helix-turn-helix protein [Bacillota bacterium]
MNGLGSRIKQARGCRSQEELASMVNVDRTTLGSWEIGRREPDLDHLVQIADITEVSLDWLAGRDKTSPAQTKIYNSPEWRSIIDYSIVNQVAPEKLMTLLKAALSLK